MGHNYWNATYRLARRCGQWIHQFELVGASVGVHLHITEGDPAKKHFEQSHGGIEFQLHDPAAARTPATGPQSVLAHGSPMLARRKLSLGE